LCSAACFIHGPWPLALHSSIFFTVLTIWVHTASAEADHLTMTVLSSRVTYSALTNLAVSGSKAVERAARPLKPSIAAFAFSAASPVFMTIRAW